MPFLLLLIGAVLIISAVRNTHGTLATALATDVPPYLKWALAIVAVGAIGYVPKMQPISRMLLALVFVVIVLKNYQAAINGFKLAGTAPAATQAVADPGTQYAANPASPNITSANVTGTAPATSQTAINTPLGPFDPAAYLAAYSNQSGFGSSTGSTQAGSATA